MEKHQSMHCLVYVTTNTSLMTKLVGFSTCCLWFSYKVLWEWLFPGISVSCSLACVVWKRRWGEGGGSGAPSMWRCQVDTRWTYAGEVGPISQIVHHPLLIVILDLTGKLRQTSQALMCTNWQLGPPSHPPCDKRASLIFIGLQKLGRRMYTLGTVLD